MNSKTIGLVAFFAGMVLALAGVFLELGGWTVQVLIVLGVLAGFFHTFKDKLVLLGVVYLSLAAAGGSMSELFVVGQVITEIVHAWVGFLGSVVLTAMMVWGGANFMAGKAQSYPCWGN
jgi:hypothetical protein